jgi:hypothetical protein
MSESTPHNRAQEILQQFYTCWRGIASNLYINRSNIGQFVLLSLRFGQLLAAVVIGTVYCSLIHQHRHHICRLYPQTYQCQTRGREPKTNEVPWVYILALFTVSAILPFAFSKLNQEAKSVYEINRVSSPSSNYFLLLSLYSSPMTTTPRPAPATAHKQRKRM